MEFGCFMVVEQNICSNPESHFCGIVLNKDGRVYVNDLLLILRYVVGGYGIILE